MFRIHIGLKILGILFLGFAITKAEQKAATPAKELVYLGSIAEDATDGDQVKLKPPLFVRDKNRLTGDNICGYTIYKSHSELPFAVELTDRKSGAAKIVLVPGYSLNYERRSQYSFEIAAHDCVTGRHADREKVLIKIKDVNEYPPQWTQDTYIAEVFEGRLYNQIIQLQTVDQDGSDKLSRVCHYHILTPDVPFRIDNQGYLLNTEVLDYSIKHNYILEVKAEDCGGQQSDKMMVNIQVKQKAKAQSQPLSHCQPGWTGIDSRVDYVPGSKQQLVAENAHLELCGASCPEPQISARLELNTDNTEKTCDRDIYSLQSQRKLCGASTASIDLLPNPTVGGWNKPLPTEVSHVADHIYAFDGISNAIEVSPEKIEPHLGEEFMISTWMKHTENPEDEAKDGTKEHILCFSDGEYHNRHHYSLFVHNCRLVLLLRREPDTGVNLNVFKEAEWRWSIPQVCDGQWHHYAVNAELPQVQLFIDGQHFVDEKGNPVVVDDWPLHPSKNVVDYKLVIGACWHGKDRQMTQMFRGELAGLSVLKGSTEDDRVIQCLNNCREKLDFHAMDQMETGMSLSLNSEMSELTINGHTVAGVERLMHRVGYSNNRLFPIPGHRALNLSTEVNCGPGTPDVTIDPVEYIVMVLQPEKPIITVTGTEHIVRDETDVRRGSLIMRDVEIQSRSHRAQEEVDVDEDAEDMGNAREFQIDSCTVRVEPNMNLDVEHLRYPENLVSQLRLEASQNEGGLIIAGADKVFNYQEVLREIHYVHTAPGNINNRQFIVTCTELNGRFVSNDFVLQLDVIHKTHQEAAVPGHQNAAKLMQPVKQMSVKDSLVNSVKSQNSVASIAGSGTGVGMIVIIVVCVGFLMFMIVLGVIRIRSAHQQRTTEVTVEDKPEMEWDNSALTITVNPMDQEAAYEDEHEMNGLRPEDSDSEEDDVSVGTHDDIESSEEEAEKVKDRDLEWDDSTLTF